LGCSNASLARWLVRHLDDPTLLLWLVKHGNQLNNQLESLIEHRLGELKRYEIGGNVEELIRIRTNAPNAIPRQAMRTLWRLLLGRRIKSNQQNRDFFWWREKFKHEGLTVSVRLALREALTPYISLRKPFNWGMIILLPSKALED